MNPTPDRARVRRTRVIAATFAVLNAIAIAMAFLLAAAAEPGSYPSRDAPVTEVAAAAERAASSHPFGALLVPYEHAKLVRYGARAQAADPADAAWLDEERSYVAGSTHVFHIVLGEMTLLVAAMYLLGLIGALMALSGRPGWVIAGAVLMLLAAPVPIVSVGPASVVLTSYLIAGGVLLLIVRPKLARASLSADHAAALAGDARGMIIAGVVMLALGGGGLALALAARGNAKLWIGIVACLVGGVVCLISGLVSLANAHKAVER